MARAYDDFSSLRLSRRESERLIVALLLSVMLHLTVYSGYRAGKHWGLWNEFRLPPWLRLLMHKPDLQATLGRNMQPNIFVDVSHADDDAPSETKFYSNKNSRAANPTEGNQNVPKINGIQTYMPKTETQTKFVRQQASAADDGAKDKQPDQAPKNTPKDSKTESAPQLAKLQPSLQPSMSPPLAEMLQTPGETEQRTPQPQAPAQRPRTLRQALAARQQTPGLQMRQDGGVPRRASWASLDVRSTSFGDYDSELIAAIQQRWYDLLDNHRYAEDRDGKVILHFKLKSDGTVIEMETLDNNVGEVLGYLCQESIEEAAPFAKWPSDMVREIGSNYRDMTFTFYYY